MKTLKTLFFSVLVALMAVPAFAQTATTRTALSAAVAGTASTTVISVVSATGMTASTNSAPTYLAVCDGYGLQACELMRLDSISGTNLTVRRAQDSNSIAHQSGSIVWYGTIGSVVTNSGSASGVFVSATPSGTCTRASSRFLPIVNYRTGDIVDCIVSTTATTDQWMVVNTVQRTSFYPSKRLAVTASTYTALLNDSIIGVNTNAATTITLPACTGCEGKWYFVMDMAGGVTNAPTTITISGSAGQLVNSGASAPIVASAVRNQGGWIFFDGASNSWYIPRAAEDR